jgi:2,4-dienoyl-CoA reductase-like NADH-dependent reductase (Old Yellow Enzyme family)
MAESLHLFSPLQIRGVTLRNRIAVSPMCQYSSEEGHAQTWHLVHLGSFAVGGAGLVMIEASAVTPDGRISPEDLGIWDDEHVVRLKRITEFIEGQGAVAGMQLAHAGRKASTRRPWATPGGIAPLEEGGWTRVVGPSEIPFSDRMLTPVALDEAEIGHVVHAFASAARRALDAGFRVVEIHAAHGYLLHEFASPLSNTREDAYGGSFENRTRIHREVAVAIRNVWPDDLPLLMRVSASDWVEGGWTIDDTVRLAKDVHGLGVDMVDCSSGGNVPYAQIPVGPGYQVPFARAVKAAGVPTVAVGMITDPHQADGIIREGEADLVMLAREFLRDPHWPHHAAQVLGVNIPWPSQYERAKPG